MSKNSQALKKDQTLDLSPLVADVPFFSQLPPGHLQELSKSCLFKEVKKGEKILTQGEETGEVCFLISGTVGLHINGKLSSFLKRKGDLIGEANFIAPRPNTATVIAETECQIILFQINDLRTLHPEIGDYFTRNLYKFYAIMLTEKLEQATDHNNRYEIALRQLQEAQTSHELTIAHLEGLAAKKTSELEQKNTALLASHMRLEGINEKRDQLFELLRQLQQIHLKPLLKSFHSLIYQLKGKHKSEVEKGIHHVSKTIFELTPLIEAYDLEKEARKAKILVLDAPQGFQFILKVAFGGTGAQVDFVSSVDEAKEKLQKGEYHLFCLGDHAPNRLNQFDFSRMSCQTLLFVSEEGSREDLSRFSSLNHVVTLKVPSKTFAIKGLQTTVSKLMAKDIFGIQKYLSWGTEVNGRQVHSSSQRKEVVEEMNDHFKSLGIRESLRSSLRAVAEEMLMNMIYDAPTDEHGDSRYNHVERTTKIKLLQEEKGHFYFACDGSIVALCAKDPFGGLKRETVLSYLHECHQRQGSPGETKEGKAGAGLGLYQMMLLADQVVFNVHPMRRTEVIALFHLDNKESSSGLLASLHFFELS